MALHRGVVWFSLLPLLDNPVERMVTNARPDFGIRLGLVQSFLLRRKFSFHFSVSLVVSSV